MIGINRKGFLKKIFVIFLMVSVLANLVPIGVSAETRVGTQTFALSDYDSEDVSMINSIITNNGLTGYSQNDPANWNFITWTNTIPMQINELDFSGKALSGDLSLSGLNSLEWLDIHEQNDLNSVTLSGMNDFKVLNVRDCANIKEITLNNLSLMNYVYISSNMNLEIIDFNNLPSLSSVNVDRNLKLKTFTLVDFPIMENVYLYGNEALEQVKLQKLPKLEYFQLELLPELTQFEISDVESLTGLYLTSLPKLESLILDGDVNGMPKLDNISIGFCGIKELHLSNFPVLDRAYLNNNKISDLQMDNLIKLVHLYIIDNELTEIDFRNLPMLSYVIAYSNRLYDVSKMPSSIVYVWANFQNITRTFYTNDVSTEVNSFKLPDGTIILKGQDGIDNNTDNVNPAYNSNQPDIINANFTKNGDMLTADIGQLESADMSITASSYIINLIGFVKVVGENITLPVGESENINYSLASDILPGYTPTFTFEQVSGEEYFTVDDSGKVTGIKPGEGKVKIILSTKEDTSLRNETIVDVTILKDEVTVNKPDEVGSEEIIAENNGSKDVVTGDESQMTQWIVTGGLAFALIACLYITKKKKEQ